MDGSDVAAGAAQAGLQADPQAGMDAGASVLPPAIGDRATVLSPLPQQDPAASNENAPARPDTAAGTVGGAGTGGAVESGSADPTSTQGDGTYRAADLLAFQARYEQLLQMAIAREPAADESKGEWERALALYTTLQFSLSRRDNLAFYPMACSGLSGLMAGKTELAATIARELAHRTSTTSALSEVMRGLLISLLGMTGGLYALTLVAALAGVGLMDRLAALALEHTDVTLAALAGFAGGVASLLLRLAEFEALKGRSRHFLMFTGLLQPILGMLFACVIAAIFLSGIVNLAPETRSSTSYFFIVIGFLSGFSERFAKGIIGRTEDNILDLRPPAATKP
ncbi:hypothetical protein [Oleisolibacter albus]|uniref:hypothetical protein n=1 Tax=Oleisolibacter albus TaxID=2171757 RepID=UPI000DF11852|nr:hypothetical protein [Oleisolibacter albus]